MADQEAVLRYGTPSLALAAASNKMITMSPSAKMPLTVGTRGFVIRALNGWITSSRKSCRLLYVPDKGDRTNNRPFCLWSQQLEGATRAVSPPIKTRLHDCLTGFLLAHKIPWIRPHSDLLYQAFGLAILPRADQSGPPGNCRRIATIGARSTRPSVQHAIQGMFSAFR